MVQKAAAVVVIALAMSACLVPVTVGSEDGGPGGSGGGAGGSAGSGGSGGAGGCSGCIDGSGVCQLGTSASACGTGGNVCAACASWDVCGAGICQHGSPGCTFGQDETCNEASWVTAWAGQCLADGSCACGAGMQLNPSTGRCRPAGIYQTLCEAHPCAGDFIAVGGAVSGWCGTQPMLPGCSCAFDATTNDYQQLCTGACNPDAGVTCLDFNCGPANCVNAKGTRGTSCVASGHCEYTAVPPVGTPCGATTCTPGQFCMRQQSGVDGGASTPLGCVDPTGPCTAASTCSDRVCFATDPCQTQCSSLQISDAGIYLDCMGV